MTPLTCILLSGPSIASNPLWLVVQGRSLKNSFISGFRTSSPHRPGSTSGASHAERGVPPELASTRPRGGADSPRTARRERPNSQQRLEKLDRRAVSEAPNQGLIEEMHALRFFLCSVLCKCSSWVCHPSLFRIRDFVV